MKRHFLDSSQNKAANCTTQDCTALSKENIENCTKSGFSKPDREILHAVAKTTAMASESLKDLLASVDDCGCEDVLKHQLDCYFTIYKVAKDALESIDEDGDKVGGMQKMMLWTSTKWDMMMDDSHSKIAQLLIRGTAMGVCEVGKVMNDYKSVSTKACICLGDTTMHCMSEFVDQLKTLLQHTFITHYVKKGPANWQALFYNF